MCRCVCVHVCIALKGLKKTHLQSALTAHYPRTLKTEAEES